MESNAPNGKESSSSPLNPRAPPFVTAASSSLLAPSSPAASIQFGLLSAVSAPLLGGSPLAGSTPRHSPWAPPSRSPGHRPAAGDTEGQMAFEQEKLVRHSRSGSYQQSPVPVRAMSAFTGYAVPPQYQQDEQQQQYHQYHNSLPAMQGWYENHMEQQQQQQYQMPEAPYHANLSSPFIGEQQPFFNQAPMDPVYCYQTLGQQQETFAQQAQMEPVYHYQPHLAEQQHRSQPAPMERQPPANAPSGPRRHTLDPPINFTPGGSRHPGRRRGPRHSENGFHRAYPFASPGYEGYIIKGCDNNNNDNNMPRPPCDRPLASVAETPPRTRPTIHLPGMAHPRTAYATGNPQQQQNRTTAAYDPYTSFQQTGSLARGGEHPNHGNFSFGGGPAQFYSRGAMTPHPQGSRNSLAPAQGFTSAQSQPDAPKGATTTNMSGATAQGPASSSVGPAPSYNANAMRPAQTQPSANAIMPRRPTAQDLSFGPGPSSSPIQTYTFPGQPHTARGQPIDLPRPRQNPLAIVSSLVARGFDVPSEPVNQGNLAQQTLTNDLDNQARTAPAFERGELTFMDNGTYRRELERRQHAAAQRAAERWAGGEITEEQARNESKVRGWDIQQWKVAGEAGRERRYSKSEGGL